MRVYISFNDEKIKYLTKEELIFTNKAAIREKRNRAIDEDYVDSLPDNINIPILYAQEHNKDEVRASVCLDGKSLVQLDMSLTRFKTLPEVTLKKDGTTIFESSKSVEKRKLYAKKREWIEKVIRQPVRDRGFRKKVLDAYGNQCAVCEINTPSLLRAAHIMSVPESNDDSISNGICLCVLHEVAFDRNILKITPEYKIEINGDSKIKVDFSQIRLPENKENHPSIFNLSWKYEKK